MLVFWGRDDGFDDDDDGGSVSEGLVVAQVMSSSIWARALEGPSSRGIPRIRVREWECRSGVMRGRMAQSRE